MLWSACFVVPNAQFLILQPILYFIYPLIHRICMENIPYEWNCGIQREILQPLICGMLRKGKPNNVLLCRSYETSSIYFNLFLMGGKGIYSSRKNYHSLGVVICPLHIAYPHFNIIKLILIFHYYLLFTNKKMKAQEIKKVGPRSTR